MYFCCFVWNFILGRLCGVEAAYMSSEVDIYSESLLNCCFASFRSAAKSVSAYKSRHCVRNARCWYFMYGIYVCKRLVKWIAYNIWRERMIIVIIYRIAQYVNAVELEKLHKPIAIVQNVHWTIIFHQASGGTLWSSRVLVWDRCLCGGDRAECWYPWLDAG